VDRGFYLEQLRRLWFYFPRERVLVLKNEYLRNQPDEALHDTCAFLGVEPYKTVESKDVHSLPYESKMGKREWEVLRGIFEHEIRGLEKVLGWDCSDWLAENND
jgi:hypothetical protein